MKYFDLNDRIRKARKNNGGTTSGVLNGWPEALSVETGDHHTPPVPEMKESVMSLTRQFLMYFGTFIGVLLSTAVNHFVNTESFELTVTFGEVVVSAAIALVIIPLVYEKLTLNPKAPVIVQFGVFVQNGIFWHVLIDSIGSAL